MACGFEIPRSIYRIFILSIIQLYVSLVSVYVCMYTCHICIYMLDCGSSSLFAKCIDYTARVYISFGTSTRCPSRRPAALVAVYSVMYLSRSHIAYIIV